MENESETPKTKQYCTVPFSTVLVPVKRYRYKTVPVKRHRGEPYRDPVQRPRGEPGHTRDRHTKPGTVPVPAVARAVPVASLEPAATDGRACGRGLVGLDGCEVRQCAIRVPVCPCVPCVSRLPPVSFYRVPGSPCRRECPSLPCVSRLPGVFLPVHVALLRHCCGSDGRCVGLSAPPGAYVHSIEQRAFLVASARTCRTTTDHRGCSVRHLPFMASFIRFAAMRFGVGDDVDTRTTGRATTAP